MHYYLKGLNSHKEKNVTHAKDGGVGLLPLLGRGVTFLLIKGTGGPDGGGTDGPKVLLEDAGGDRDRDRLVLMYGKGDWDLDFDLDLDLDLDRRWRGLGDLDLELE